jgi:elongation factor Ts
MDISAAAIKELRARTGSGIMDCKTALEETGGDVEQAIDYMRKKGLAKAAKKAGRITAEGTIVSYIHPGGKVGVLLEVNCETDFVARTEDFQALAKELAMQVAAMRPLYVSRDDVPNTALEKEREILRAEAETSGKPEQVIEKITTGRLEKFFRDTCLLEQAYMRNPDKSVRDVITEAIATIGENMTVRRFARFELNEA